MIDFNIFKKLQYKFTSKAFAKSEYLIGVQIKILFAIKYSNLYFTRRVNIIFFDYN